MGKWTSVAKGLFYPVLHPQKTMRGAVTTAKVATVAAPVGYVGWKMLTEDKCAARVVGEALVGDGATDAVATTVQGVSEIVTGGAERIDNATAALNNAGSGLNGVSGFMQNLFGGGGAGMFGNFLSNLTSGRVSGLSIFGLVASAALVFGRTGWFGKVLGGLLAMMLIGNNSRALAQATGQGEAQGQKLPYSRATVYTPENDPSRVFIKAWDTEGRELPATGITKERYDELLAMKLTPMQMYHRETAAGRMMEQAAGEGERTTIRR